MSQEKTQTPSEPTNEMIKNAIEKLDPRVTLRNLAFWLDLAIAKGRMFDALLASSQDKEQEVSSDDASSAE